MNSDPHESAAWRTFGMLDADEAAGFDEAMRQDPELRKAYREMNCLAAAVAAATVPPLAPRAGQLERLQSRLGLNPSKHPNWLGISGWAAAAALTMVLILDRNPAVETKIVRIETHLPSTKSEQRVSMPESTQQEEPTVVKETTPNTPPSGDGLIATQENDVKTIVKVETKRLIQEIEVLRGKLENAQTRDRQRFEAVPGMAWPIVMTMSPPETEKEKEPPTVAAVSISSNPPALTTILGDALAGNASYLNNIPNFRENALPGKSLIPSAIPIYDSARDSGTLVVSNLPAATANESYNLWVTTEDGAKPVHVGRLPEATVESAGSYDFSLGSKAIVPTGFFLTKDSQGATAAPSKANTVLQGPK